MQLYSEASPIWTYLFGNLMIIHLASDPLIRIFSYPDSQLGNGTVSGKVRVHCTPIILG